MRIAQHARPNPNRPTVVYSGHGAWCARAYDNKGMFQVAAKLSLPDAYKAALKFAEGDYSEARQ